MRVKNMVSALIAASLLSSFAGAWQANPSSMVGKHAPSLKVSAWRNTKDKALSLSSLKGKVVVLDFWAYW